MRIYIDTSVFGGYYDEEFQEWTVKLFREFEKGMKFPVVSDLTVQEIEGAPLNVRKLFGTTTCEKLFVDPECEELAMQYIKEKAVSPSLLVMHFILRSEQLTAWMF
jgi:hypothetical protein